MDCNMINNTSPLPKNKLYRETSYVEEYNIPLKDEVYSRIIYPIEEEEKKVSEPSNREIMNLLKDINTKLTTMEYNMLNMESRLDHIENECNNMGEHIGFVNTVYNQVQRPMNALLNIITNSLEYIPTQSNMLPVYE